MTEQSGQAELVRLIEQSPNGTRVFCVGVGNEVNRPLLSQLADQAGGLSAFLSRGDDFRQQAEAFRRKLTRPAATNLQLTFDGGDVYDVTPEALPSLYHGVPLRIYGRYRQPGAMRLKLEGDILGAAFEHEAELQLPRMEANNPQIERMWASCWVEAYLRDARAAGETDSQSPRIEKVIRLCEEYSIVSEYASFIVLENDAEYRRWKIERRNAIRIDRDRTAAQRATEQLARLRERAAESTGPQLASAEQPAAEQATDVLSRIAPQAPAVNGNSPQPNSNSTDFGPGISVPSAGGGGAIDPVSGLIAAGLAISSALAARRRRRRADRDSGL
jgi:Ca-activated chloride channel family protein